MVFAPAQKERIRLSHYDGHHQTVIVSRLRCLEQRETKPTEATQPPLFRMALEAGPGPQFKIANLSLASLLFLTQMNMTEW
jgi:hypothetical protein